MDDTDESFGIDRRTVLKSTAMTAVGAGAFTGVASATDAKRINFCGCSQVCVVNDDGGTFDVVVARESEDGWEIDFVEQPVDEEGNKLQGEDFCYEEEDGEKIIGVRPHGRAYCGGVSETLYCNPGRCARKALEWYRNDCDRAACVNCDPDTEECVPAFGTFDDPKGGDVEVIQGRCGDPGKDAPGRGNGTPGK